MPAGSKRVIAGDDEGEVEEQSPQAKRPRQGHYGKGSVMKIRVHNFMVYRDVEVVPGSRLNLILGPNGTGKSTLVCALCVGLAGSPTLLGRADVMAEFVLQGEAEGWVEITLSKDDEGRPIVFRRQLRAKDNGSDWRIDGRPARLNEVVKRVKELNVQLDNLCQAMPKFVPQDRVSEFARLKPEELLAATQKAIGNAALYNLHQELIESRKHLSTEEGTKANIEGTLADKRDQNQTIERDVQRFEQRERLLGEKALAERKLVWVKFSDAQEELQQNKDRERDGKKLLKKKVDEFDTAQAPRRAKEAALHKARVHASKCASETKSVEQVVINCNTKMGELTSDLAAKWEELESLEEKEANRLKVIEAQRRLLDSKQQAVDRAAEEQSRPRSQKSAEEIRQMQTEANDKAMQESMVQGEVDDLAREFESIGRQRTSRAEQLGRLKDARMQRLRWLDQKHRGIMRFTEWLAKNQNRYRSRVYGPVLAEINVREPMHQRFVEGQLGNPLLARFITQGQEDLMTLQQDALDQFDLRIVTTAFTGNPQQVLTHPSGDAANYSRYHVTHTLDEVIEAAPIVKHVLNDETNLTSAYVATAQCNAARFLHENLRIKKLWTPENVYSIVGSAYNPNARSEAVSAVRAHGNGPLAQGGLSNEAECAEMQAQIGRLDQQMAELEQQRRARESHMNALARQVEALRKECKRAQDEAKALGARKKKAEVARDKEKRALDALEKGKSLMEGEGRIKEEVARLNDVVIKEVEKLGRLLAKQLEGMRQHCLADLTAKELTMQKAGMDDACQQQEHEIENLRRTVQHLATIVDQSRAVVRAAKIAAEEVTGPMTEELKQSFIDLPASIEGLEDMMRRKQEEADEIVCSNPSVMQEYQTRLQQIASLEAQASSAQEKISLHLSTIAERKARWAPELVSIVAKINENFGSNFRDIACAGEVTLGMVGAADDGAPNFDDPALDYEKVAIHIRVKFRDSEPMQLLTPLRQSGGERALTTMLYLIAIQGVTVCPFRVVDEINQGMDQIYERQVFKLLSVAAGRPGTPQCFLLTPKLLNDLPYSPEVTILSIVNGPHLQHVRRPFNMVQLVGNRPRLLSAAA